MRPVSAASLAIFALWMPIDSFALDFGFASSAGVMTTDNILRGSTDKVDAEILSAAAAFQLREEKRTVSMDVLGGAIYRSYSVDGLSDDTLPSLNALIQATVLPERFSWSLSDHLGQRALNANDGLVPSDRETVNVASTGPDFRMPLGDSLWFAIAARYGLVDFEDSPFDNHRLAARTGLEHTLDSGRLISLYLSNARTEFEDSDTEFDIRTASIGYLSEGRRGIVDASVGVTSLDDGAGSHDGFFGDLRMERQVSRRGSVMADLVHRLADTSDVFRRRQDLEPDINTIADVVASDQALRETAVELGYSWVGRRTRIGTAGTYFTEEYFDDNVSANRSGKGAYVLGEFRIRPTLLLEARTEWRRESPDLEPAERFTQHHLSAVWTFARTLSLELGGERFERRGSSPLEYQETRFYLQLDWQPRQIDLTGQRPGLDTAARRRIGAPR